MHLSIKNLGNRAKLREKINAKCYECIYDPNVEGSWRKQVENCLCNRCPLYVVRPRTIASSKEAK